MSEPTVLILTPKRRGRPRQDDPGTTLCTWVPASTYSKLVRAANQQEKSVSRLVRDLLARTVRGR